MSVDLDKDLICFEILQDLVSEAQLKNADIGSLVLQAYFLGRYGLTETGEIKVSATKPKLTLIKGGKND